MYLHQMNPYFIELSTDNLKKASTEVFNYPDAEHSYKRSVFSSAKYVFTSWGDYKLVMAPDKRKISF